MPTPKEEDIKIRVPASMKVKLNAIADSRITTLSEIAREALLEYVARHGMSADQLREEPPVNYGQKEVGASQMDTETQIVGILKGKYGKKKKPPGSPPGKK